MCHLPTPTCADVSHVQQHGLRVLPNIGGGGVDAGKGGFGGHLGSILQPPFFGVLFFWVLGRKIDSGCPWYGGGLFRWKHLINPPGFEVEADVRRVSKIPGAQRSAPERAAAKLSPKSREGLLFLGNPSLGRTKCFNSPNFTFLLIVV